MMTKIKKILLFASIILVIILIFVFIRVTGKTRPQNTLTVPVISPRVTVSKAPQTPLDTTNPHNPEQKLIFNWGTISPEIPATIKNYSIATPLINQATITTAANKFGFKTTERSPFTDEDSYLWINNSASLFGSAKQNQILFNSTVELSKHVANISTNDASSIAKEIISNLIGETLLSTFESQPEIKYLFIRPQTEQEPTETTPDIANIININFQQLVNGLPLLTLSKRGETISIVIDTNKKIYNLYIYGGYSKLTETGEINPLNFAQLKEIASTKSIRISYSKDIPSEAAFTEAKSVRVDVKSVGVGYFQRADNSLFPVFIIIGDMSATGIAKFPAIYIVPATVN